MKKKYVRHQYYAAEDGTRFPASRVYFLGSRRVQHALTRTEAAIYDCLFNEQTKQKQGQVSIGYREIARDIGTSKRHVALTIKRLLEKGFIEILECSYGALLAPILAAGGDAATAEIDTDPRQATIYRVLTYAQAKHALKLKGYEFAVRTKGGGVVFVEPIDPEADAEGDSLESHSPVAVKAPPQRQPSEAITESKGAAGGEAKKQLSLFCKDHGEELKASEWIWIKTSLSRSSTAQSDFVALVREKLASYDGRNPVLKLKYLAGTLERNRPFGKQPRQENRKWLENKEWQSTLPN